MEINPQNVDVMINKGSVSVKLNMLNESMMQFNRALEIDPENVDVMNSKGFVFSMLGFLLTLRVHLCCIHAVLKLSRNLVL